MNPLASIDAIVQAALLTNENINEHLNQADVFNIISKMEREIIDKGLINAIPILNMHNHSTNKIQSNSLVRYRGLVQDMRNPELFAALMEQVEIGESKRECKVKPKFEVGLFRDSIVIENGFKLNENNSFLSERQVLYCVPIPGETDWSREKYNNSQTASVNAETKDDSIIINNKPKRKFEEEDEGAEIRDKDDMDRISKRAKKISLDNEDKKENDGQVEDVNEDKKEKSFNYTNTLNYPLKEESEIAVIVKLYCKENIYKINDVVEFVGIYCNDPEYSYMGEEVDWMNEEEKGVHFPPSSIVPRLHVLLHSKIENSVNQTERASLSLNEKEILEARETLFSELMKVLKGDSVVSEFVLLNMISNTHFRREGVAIGNMPLNVTLTTPTITSSIFSLLQNVLPKACKLDISCKFLSETSFQPKKDYEKDRLISSPLQLSEGTHLLLNELSLNAGRINQQGIHNINTIHTMAVEQKLSYDFTYYTTDFNTSISVLILSDGRSIFKIPEFIPLRPSKLEADEEMISTLTLEKLENIRLYLKEAKSWLPEVDESIANLIQEDFVKRRTENDSLDASDLHRWLNLSRLLSASFGASKITKDHWHRALELESERIKRISVPVKEN